MNDAFPSDRFGLLARAVWDPVRGYWEAYQDGYMIVPVISDENHRVSIGHPDVSRSDFEVDYLVTIESKYPEINWAFQTDKDGFIGTFPDVNLNSAPILCYFGGQDALY